MIQHQEALTLRKINFPEPHTSCIRALAQSRRIVTLQGVGACKGREAEPVFGSPPLAGRLPRCPTQPPDRRHPCFVPFATWQKIGP